MHDSIRVRTKMNLYTEYIKWDGALCIYTLTFTYLYCTLAPADTATQGGVQNETPKRMLAFYLLS